MLPSFTFIEARFGFQLEPVYLGTDLNNLADDLPCGNLVSFLSKVPNADQQPTPPPQDLLNLLLDTAADWLSPTWTHLFRDIFTEVWPSPHKGHMEQH